MVVVVRESGGVRAWGGRRTVERLKNIIQDGNSYQMLKKLDKAPKHCFAGVQPKLSDTPQFRLTSIRHLLCLPGNC